MVLILRSFIRFMTRRWHLFKLYFDLRRDKTGLMTIARQLLCPPQAVTVNDTQCAIVLSVFSVV